MVSASAITTGSRTARRCRRWSLLPRSNFATKSPRLGGYPPVITIEPTDALRRRFLRKVSPEPMSGCWLWVASVSRGYGAFYFRKKVERAHRVAWILSRRKDIPQGMLVLHRCSNRSCVNPEHLYAGSYSDNLEDAIRDGVHHNAGKTHCLRGHPLSGDNLVVRRKKTGGFERVCLTCKRMFGRRYMRRRRKEARHEN